MEYFPFYGAVPCGALSRNIDVLDWSVGYGECQPCSKNIFNDKIMAHVHNLYFDKFLKKA